MLTYQPDKRISSEAALTDEWFTILSKKENLKDELMLESMENLRKFKFLSTMQKAVMTYLATHVINKEEEKKMRQIFELFDSNHDGQLSKEELIEGYKMLFEGDVQMAIKEIERTMKRIDINKNGTIDYNGK